MKKLSAQSTLEYVILIGLAAAVIATMAPYITNAFRSNIRVIEENFSPEPVEEGGP